jgi:outer membrane protein assembly factor BamE (lipoprotein component of BamABCDE complex)
MKRLHSMLITGVVLALPAVAFASPTIAFYRDGPVKAIQAGQTEQDVQSLMGNPMSTRNVAGETHYYYRVEDNFGERSTLDVAFDGDGYVIRKGELRMLD